MKKELFALLLLCALMAGALCSMAYLKRFTGELTAQLDTVQPLVAEGQWETAQETVWRILQDWQDADDYARIFLRHPDIDSIAEDLHSLLGAIEDRESGACRSASLNLRRHFSEICQLESLRPGSIF